MIIRVHVICVAICDYRDAYVVDLLEVQYIFKRHNALMRISPDIDLITVK